jgi:hypothetical protein
MIEMCGGLPLALDICAGWAQRCPALTLSAAVAELRRRDGLDAFAGTGHGCDVRAVFSWSYRRLSADAAALFRALGWRSVREVSTAAAGGIAGRDRPATLELLSELTNARLLSEVRPGRYAMHELVRAYSAELGETGRASAGSPVVPARRPCVDGPVMR